MLPALQRGALLAEPPNSCVWDTTTHTCQKTICEDIATPTACTSNPVCTYYMAATACFPAPCSASTEADCIVLGAGCLRCDTCIVTPCYHDTDNCISEVVCEWDNVCPDPVDHPCKVTPCVAAVHSTAQGCDADPVCQWSVQSSFERLACTEFTIEKCCTSFENGTWDISQTPVVQRAVLPEDLATACVTTRNAN